MVPLAKFNRQFNIDLYFFNRIFNRNFNRFWRFLRSPASILKLNGAFQPICCSEKSERAIRPKGLSSPSESLCSPALFWLMVVHSRPVQIKLILLWMLHFGVYFLSFSTFLIFNAGVSGGTSTCESSFGSRYHPSASSTGFEVPPP